jgi:CBS domain-containing protein
MHPISVPKVLCDEVMTKDIVFCTLQDTVLRAAQMMLEHHVGSLPIVEEPLDRALRGVLTDRDIVIRVVAGGRDPERTTVETVMTRDIVTCRPADDLDEAVNRMMMHQVRRIFVEEHNMLRGVISQADIASRGGERSLTALFVERVSQPGIPEPTTT